MINNKTLFEIYLSLRTIFFIVLAIFIVIIITTKLLQIEFFSFRFSVYDYVQMNAMNGFIICFLWISEKIKPAFIEFHLTGNEIIIKTYNPHLNRWESPFILFRYKKRIREIKIRRDEYIDYKLTIGKFGLQKELKLQKLYNNGVYETSNINISLLGRKKYTNLILAIDRLRTNIFLN
jgi:hypothetical protein